MSTTDMTKLKLQSQNCKAGGSCYLRVTSLFVTDVSGNSVDAIGDAEASSGGSKYLVQSLVEDATCPQAVSFDFNANAHTMTVVMDEPVSRLDLTGLTLYSQVATGLEPSFTLSSSQWDTAYVDPLRLSLKINLHAVDVILLQALPDLASRENNTYLSVGVGVAQDVSPAGNLNCPTVNNLLVSLFAPDTTPPSIERFNLYDPTTGVLTVEFDEAVDPSTLNASRIVLQSAALLGRCSTDESCQRCYCGSCR
jgi:hypothetical protein